MRQIRLIKRGRGRFTDRQNVSRERDTEKTTLQRNSSANGRPPDIHRFAAFHSDMTLTTYKDVLKLGNGVSPEFTCTEVAEIAQLGERQTEDLKVSGSIPGFGKGGHFPSLALQHPLYAEIAQLGERQTEDLKVPGSIPGFGKGGHFPSLALQLKVPGSIPGFGKGGHFPSLALQLGERQTEDLKVPGSIPGFGKGGHFPSLALQHHLYAEIAQLGERQTEDLKVPGSIPGFGKGGHFPSLALQHPLYAEIAQLGERQTEDLKVPGSIPGFGKGGHFPSLALQPDDGKVTNLLDRKPGLNHGDLQSSV
ncbi:hypothetical protein WMY93_032708 [Mugilogobius chulae]|uniref:Uncharacterized protein n=1 Tax=Mugilogobius chulae TaxID=88201 RepID=A0AAW0MQ35_9GOBI